MKKPHVIMFVADQYRMDSIGYGSCEAAVTPNFNQLAEEGLGFQHAFCQNTVCVPSRISFMTGYYPHVKGYRTMHHLAGSDEPNLLKNMKDNGYHVYWGGRNDILREDVDLRAYCHERNNRYEAMFNAYRGRSEDNKGERTKKVLKHMKEEREKRMKGPERFRYSHYYGVEDVSGFRDADMLEIQDAITFIRHYDGEEPLMLYLALALPHPPYQVDQKYYDQIDPNKIPKPIRLTPEQLNMKPAMERGIRANQKLYHMSDEELKEIKRVYLAMGTKLDDGFGQLMHALKEKGMYDDSLIMMFSDHGDYTGDFEIAEKSQNTFEDVLTNVPLIIKPPFNVDSKLGEEALVELIDLQATIYDIADIEAPHTHFGQSLLPILKGKKEHRDFVFTEGGRIDGEEHCTDSGHAKSNEYWARTVVQNEIPGHTKALMVRNKSYKFVYRLYEKNEFYDLEKDPYELNNEIENEAYASFIHEFKKVALKHYMETTDVVPKRRDARVERSL